MILCNCRCVRLAPRLQRCSFSSQSSDLLHGVVTVRFHDEKCWWNTRASEPQSRNRSAQRDESEGLGGKGIKTWRSLDRGPASMWWCTQEPALRHLFEGQTSSSTQATWKERPFKKLGERKNQPIMWKEFLLSALSWLVAPALPIPQTTFGQLLMSLRLRLQTPPMCRTS